MRGRPRVVPGARHRPKNPRARCRIRASAWLVHLPRDRAATLGRGPKVPASQGYWSVGGGRTEEWDRRKNTTLFCYVIGVGMPLPARRHTAPARFPDFFDWIDSPWSALLPFGPAQTRPSPGRGPAWPRGTARHGPGERSSKVTVDSGILTIHAERREETKKAAPLQSSSTARSHVPSRCPRAPIQRRSLPSTTRESFKVSVPVSEQVKPTERRIAVASGPARCLSQQAHARDLGARGR